jgi:homogentisate 1,2-dioxygenase
MCGAGDPAMKDGIGIHTYAFNQNMGKKAFYSADGDFLIVPQHGTLFITTEFGRLIVEPLEICVIQRGIKFKVDLDPSKDSLSAEE